MSAIEFLEKFLFPVDLFRDYWVDDEVKRGSARGMLLTRDRLGDWYLKRKDLGRCWVSVCYYGSDLKPEFLDRVVYDLDIPLKKDLCKRLRKEDRSLFREWLNFVKIEAYRLYHFISRRYSTTPILIYTGNRGYQIHVLLDRLIEAEYYSIVFNILRAGFVERRIPEWLIRETRSILGDFELVSVIDWHVTDSSRMVRVPYTRHESGGVCTILNPSALKPLKASRAIGLLGRAVTADWIERIIEAKTELEKASRVRLSRKKRRERRYSIEELLEHHSPPCVRAIWEKFKARIEVNHYSRLVLVWYLMNKGYPKKEVTKLFELLPDYDRKLTSYQVEYAYKKRYKMPSCRWMKERGLCISDCSRRISF